MTNRSTFPQQIDSFLEYAEVSPSDKTNVERYQVLLMQETRTSDEETELINLKTSLINKIISSESINKMNDSITNLQDYFLNRVMADLGKLDIGILSNDLGNLSSLTTTDKSNAVSAINEIQGEVGDISRLMTSEKASAVGAINELNSGKLDKTDASNTYANNSSLTSHTDNTDVHLQSGERDKITKSIQSNGELMQYGFSATYRVNNDDTTDFTINFPKAFSTIPIVLLTPQGNTQFTWFLDWTLYSRTTTGFTIRIRNNGTINADGFIQFNWQAIGRG